MKQKTALITGASSGIGKELAIIHASKGGNLVITARRKEKLLKLKDILEKKYKISVYVITKDLTDQKAPEEIYKEVKDAGIEIDYLINNAGFGGHGLFQNRDLYKDLSMIQVNIVALTYLTGLFIPDFVKRRSGKILNTSSTASLMPGPLQAVYYATKAYVTSFSNALAQELSGTDITVTALLPGATKTEFANTSGMNKTDMFNKPFSAYEVAMKGYEAMIKGTLNIVAGVSIMQNISLKMIPIIPLKVKLKLIHQMQQEKQ